MEKSGEKNDFDSIEFEKRLTNLKDTQDSIQAMSAWCLQNRAYHKKVVSSWLTVLKQVKVEHRLTLFYLANDVIQYSKRKNYEFVESWGTALQRATTMVRDEKVKQKIERIFRIWEQRGIYNEEFLTDLHGLLSINPAKKPQPNENDDEQASITVASIRNCMRLEKDTDKCFKALPKAPLYDTETLHLLKDRRHVEDVEREIIEKRTKLEQYVKTLSNEIKARSMLITVLDQADAFYHNQRGEVKVVANAYRNFGNRIKTMKRKLDELVKTLPSPIPSPDINAPSPGPADNDFILPGEKDFDQNVFNKQTNGLMGYMDGANLPFDINDFSATSPKQNESQHIQVISSCGVNKENDVSIDDFFKSLMPDSYTPVPQPVPPVASSSSTNYYGGGYTAPPPPTSYESHLHRFSATMHDTQFSTSSSVPPFPRPPTNPFVRPPQQNPYGAANPSPYQQSTASNFNAPLSQPPLPPFERSTGDEYNPDSWEMDMSWNTSQESNFDQPLDAPHSPPHYERKGVNTNIIEYIDPSVEDTLAGASDVDHRQLILPMNGLSAIGAKDRGRLVDVDHRNLISLTGSPKLTDKESSTIEAATRAMDGSASWKKDVDLRQIMTSKNPSQSPHLDTKLVPPPSPPAMLLGQSTGIDSDSGKSMNPPLLPSPRFQSPPLQKPKTAKVQNKSPVKGQNGRDNTESIDMEMSDEDFDGLPEFQNDKSTNADNNVIDGGNSSNHESHMTSDSMLGMPPNMFGSTAPNFNDSQHESVAWEHNKNASLGPKNFDSPFGPGPNTHEDPMKRPNPFSSAPQEILHQLQQQQQMLLQQQQQHMNMSRPRPLLDLPTGFNSPRPFLHGGADMDGTPSPIAGASAHNPFMLNSPRGPPQYMSPAQSPQMNYRSGPLMRGNSPYFRNQKGNIRGGFRNNFRGGNMRGNW